MRLMQQLGINASSERPPTHRMRQLRLESDSKAIVGGSTSEQKKTASELSQRN
jgi:hypothetical protein